MNKRSWITFTVVRLLAFFVPLIALLFIQVNPWIAAVLAAVIGMCVSFIFLRRPREDVARGIYEVRHAEKPLVREDDEAEDAALDALADAEVAASAAEPATAKPTAPDAGTSDASATR